MNYLFVYFISIFLFFRGKTKRLKAFVAPVPNGFSIEVVILELTSVLR